MAGVSGSGVNVKTKTELADPTESLIVKSFQNARFNSIECDVAVDIIKNNFFVSFLSHAEPFGILDPKIKLAHDKGLDNVLNCQFGPS